MSAQTDGSTTTTLAELTALEALTLFERGELSPLELTRDCLARIERHNPIVNAFCHIDGEGALNAAPNTIQDMRQLQIA
ncbi:hypothetical protein [Salinicola halimionae]|uniref:hypothetical protein n=1 Tax=Salinicola halimionae TaxID=1949081 RepID=UPI001FD8AAFC|nr:hypothetical protein [Salinicola halimionae]